MAQLRDARTSALIAEGTPLEIATVAEEFDAADVLFDGVGAVDEQGKSVFDPAEVRVTRAAELAGLENALAEASAADAPAEVRARRGSLRDAVQERRARIAAGRGKVADARRAMQEARRRVDG